MLELLPDDRAEAQLPERSTEAPPPGTVRATELLAAPIAPERGSSDERLAELERRLTALELALSSS